MDQDPKQLVHSFQEQMDVSVTGLVLGILGVFVLLLNAMAV